MDTQLSSCILPGGRGKGGNIDMHTYPSFHAMSSLRVYSEKKLRGNKNSIISGLCIFTQAGHILTLLFPKEQKHTLESDSFRS